MFDTVFDTLLKGVIVKVLISGLINEEVIACCLSIFIAPVIASLLELDAATTPADRAYNNVKLNNNNALMMIREYGLAQACREVICATRKRLGSLQCQWRRTNSFIFVLP